MMAWWRPRYRRQTELCMPPRPSHSRYRLLPAGPPPPPHTPAHLQLPAFVAFQPRTRASPTSSVYAEDFVGCSITNSPVWWLPADPTAPAQRVLPTARGTQQGPRQPGLPDWCELEAASMSGGELVQRASQAGFGVHLESSIGTLLRTLRKLRLLALPYEGLFLQPGNPLFRHPCALLEVLPPPALAAQPLGLLPPDAAAAAAAATRRRGDRAGTPPPQGQLVQLSLEQWREWVIAIQEAVVARRRGAAAAASPAAHDPNADADSTLSSSSGDGPPGPDGGSRDSDGGGSDSDSDEQLEPVRDGDFFSLPFGFEDNLHRQIGTIARGPDGRAMRHALQRMHDALEDEPEQPAGGGTDTHAPVSAPAPDMGMAAIDGL